MTISLITNTKICLQETINVQTLELKNTVESDLFRINFLCIPLGTQQKLTKYLTALFLAFSSYFKKTSKDQGDKQKPNMIIRGTVLKLVTAMCERWC